MSRSKGAERAFGKALTLWEPPEDAGEPQICIATTFTFDATFFETECVGRFLRMDSHPSESDSIAYIVEREEKLAAARICVLADRRHAREKESLRWDVLGVLVPRAIQHSKVSLLVWANQVRIIIGSGNLTIPGYRSNLEVFGALDIARSSGGDMQALQATLEFLEEVVAFAVGIDTLDSPRTKVRADLHRVREHVKLWPAGERDQNRPVPVFGTRSRSVVSQVGALWPASSGPARTAYVVSPFFDR
jgi:hypothetical protein